MKTKIILASQSPRRRELLQQIGYEFEVIPSTVEEITSTTVPDEMVMELASLKAGDVFTNLTCKKPERGTNIDSSCECDNSVSDNKKARPDVIVIGADTVVSKDGKIMGKPKSERDAIEMLKLLQGGVHQVYTGVCLVWEQEGRIRSEKFAQRTDVYFYPMSDEEINWYVSTGDCMDKAGAYGIQGICARFIEKLEGDYNNVVGLPVGRLYQELQKRFDI